MHKNIHIKSTLRQRIRTLFLFLLLGAISFAFIARAAEYIIVQRETNRLGSFYRAIGTLVPDDPDVYDLAEGIAVLEKSQYVGVSDRRKYVSATLNGMGNVDFDGGFSYPEEMWPDHIARMRRYELETGFTGLGNRSTDIITSGVLTKIEVLQDNRLDNKGARFGLNGYSPNDPLDVNGYRLTFEVDSVEFARSDFRVKEGSVIRVAYEFRDEKESAAFFDSLEIGKRYLSRGYFNRYEIALFSGPVTPNPAGTVLYLFARPIIGDDLWVYPMEPGDTVDYENPILAELREDIETLEENSGAMMVVGTKDMSEDYDGSEKYGYTNGTLTLV